MKPHFPLVLVGLASLAQANPNPATAGSEVIAEASAKLIAALTEAIAKDGTANAIGVCSERAPAIAAAVGKARGVTVRRASGKPRNPKNAATDSEKIILAAFATDMDKSEPPKPRTVTNPDESSTFFAPIVISNPLCLQCHGTPGQEISPTTLAAIQKLYPADKATGYKLDSLRGLWSINVPAVNQPR